MLCEPQEDAIRELAYSKWEQAGCPSGDGVWFWLEAEREFAVLHPSEKSSKIESVPNLVKSSLKAAEPAPLKVPTSRKRSR